MTKLFVHRHNDFVVTGWPSNAVKNWGWVYFDEMARLFNMEQSEVLRVFGALSKDLSSETPDISVIGYDGLFHQWVNAEDVESGAVRVDAVPAGWALYAEKAFNAGVRGFRVEYLESLQSYEDLPDNCWNAVYSERGWHIALAYDENGNPVSKKVS